MLAVGFGMLSSGVKSREATAGDLTDHAGNLRAGI